MQQLWGKYFDTFRDLITAGWKIYKSGKKNSTLYFWVYPHTTLPTTFRLKEANEINNTAVSSSKLFGSTYNYTYACSMFYTSGQCVEGRWV